MTTLAEIHGSDAERSLETLLKWNLLPGPVRELMFAPPRRWRFDFAYPERLLAIEVDGGSYVQGRHTRGSGFEKDIEKLNEAALIGWRVLRVTPAMIRDGRAIRIIKRGLEVGER